MFFSFYNRATDGVETGDELEEEEEEELEEVESDLGEEPLFAVAQYDFNGRNERELTFRKVSCKIIQYATFFL